ncbi:MAG: hypothetical protein HY929_04050 [Euryarchaeota archaeon]|nr:hypothetical protein [Euryarchaeota archaeon]
MQKLKKYGAIAAILYGIIQFFWSINFLLSGIEIIQLGLAAARATPFSIASAFGLGSVYLACGIFFILFGYELYKSSAATT